MPGIVVHDHSMQFHKQGQSPVNFEAANQDLRGAQFQYFGFISSFGSWIIMQFNIQSSTTIYKYYAGQTRTDYDALWNASGEYTGASNIFVTFDQIGASL